MKNVFNWLFVRSLTEEGRTNEPEDRWIEIIWTKLKNKQTNLEPHPVGEKQAHINVILAGEEKKITFEDIMARVF